MSQTVQVPGVGTLQFPDGMTQADMASAIQRNYPQIHGQQTSQQSSPLVDMALRTLQNTTGAGEGALHAVSGALAAPLAGLAGIGGALLPGKPGQGANAVNAVQQALTYQPRSALGKQIAGGVDAVGGAIPKGADAIASSAQKYGIQDPEMAGFADMSDPNNTGTVTPGMATGINTAAQGAAMLAGGKAAKGLEPADLPAPSPTITPSLINQTLKDARQSGAMVTPEYSATAGGSSGGATGAVASLSGSEVKMQQTLSKYNSRVWAPKVAAQEAGLPEGTPLTPAALDQAAVQAAGASKAVEHLGTFTPDAQLVSDLKAVGPRNPTAPEQTPQAIPPDPAVGGASTGFQPLSAPGVVQAVRDLRADARALYKATDNPEALRQAKAAWQAGDALDSFIQRQLATPAEQGGKGLPNLAEAYVAGRTRLAKIASIRDALNPATGSIDGSSLARDLDNDVPLSGGLLTIANTAKAFPKVMQVPERLPASSGPSVIEQGGAVAALLHGNVPTALAMFARPIARARVGTQGFQNRMVNPPPPSAPTLPGPIAGAPLAQPIVGQQPAQQQAGQP